MRAGRRTEGPGLVVPRDAQLGTGPNGVHGGAQATTRRPVALEGTVVARSANGIPRPRSQVPSSPTSTSVVGCSSVAVLSSSSVGVLASAVSKSLPEPPDFGTFRHVEFRPSSACERILGSSSPTIVPFSARAATSSLLAAPVLVPSPFATTLRPTSILRPASSLVRAPAFELRAPASKLRLLNSSPSAPTVVPSPFPADHELLPPSSPASRLVLFVRSSAIAVRAASPSSAAPVWRASAAASAASVRRVRTATPSSSPGPAVRTTAAAEAELLRRRRGTDVWCAVNHGVLTDHSLLFARCSRVSLAQNEVPPKDDNLLA